jgi:preprotein translocase subunit YajC
MDYTPLIILGGFFAFMYFFIIRPQRQRQKQMQDLFESLSEGDDVITIGGLHGKIVAVADKSVNLRIADGLVVTFDRDTIGKRVTDEAEDA